MLKRPGSSFEWTSYGFTVVSTVDSVAERARVLWGGTSGGITGVHEWVFSDTPGGVQVTTRESFAGDPVAADVTGIHEGWRRSPVDRRAGRTGRRWPR